MTIYRKILAGCLTLTAIAGLLGGIALVAEHRLNRMALGMYDDVFMSMSYLRSAQASFARMNTQGAAAPADAGILDILTDLDVVRDRATSPAARHAAEALRQHIAGWADRSPGAAAASDLDQEFERAVEIFADDGYRYRRSLGTELEEESRRTMLVVGAALLAALLVTWRLGRSIVPPVRRAVAIAQSIAAGRLDNLIVPHGKDETAGLLRALGSMQDSIAAALKRIQDLMDEQAQIHAGQLATEHARFEAALENMSLGLCLFGPDERLAVVNPQFIRMFGPAALGSTPDQVLRGDDLAPLLDGTANRGLASFSCDLQDGRSIAVSQRPIAGGGWVTTFEDITERRAAEERLAHMARHDILTGLPNRLLYNEHLPQAISRARRGGGVAVLCVDLDRFKAVNDALGHAVGDKLLCAVAARLEQCTRETDLVARLGGDEFAIIQEAADLPRDATALARRLVDAMAAPFDLDGHVLEIGASVGIALAQDGVGRADALLKAADLALYRAKGEGRGTFRFFEPEMDARMQERRSLELDLRRALKADEFEVYYQPLVSPEGRVNGFEALLRWHHPVRGTISPAVFIPVAEEIGLISALGAWVLRQACADAITWPETAKVAVNLSPAQFRNRALVSDVASALRESCLSPARLELEVTESVMLQDDEAAFATLHALRDLGVRLAMDDFGTGYSSLSFLHRFPFDKIKIDQSFIRGLGEREDAIAIVRAIIGLGRALGMSINAEGVETLDQLSTLRAEGCTELQGYLFSKPRPRGDVLAMLDSAAAY